MFSSKYFKTGKWPSINLRYNPNHLQNVIEFQSAHGKTFMHIQVQRKNIFFFEDFESK